MKKFPVFFLLFFCAFKPVFLTNYSSRNILEFVKTADKTMKSIKDPNIILVVGKTDSGKTTLIHYVADDYRKLISIEPNLLDMEYRIYDGLRTLVPELTTDEMGLVWYDFPDFGDAKNEAIEIATSVLLKRVIENVWNIKIVLVVDYNTFNKRKSRSSFDDLLTLTTQLLNNITKYENSVSLVVTKVPPGYNIGRHFFEVFEDSVKASTARFMSTYRLTLKNKKTDEKRKIQLIDALLKRTSNYDYPKISIFWRPICAGPLNTIPKMVKGRRNIRESIIKHTLYMKIDKNFISEKRTDETYTIVDTSTEIAISNKLTAINSNLLYEIKNKIESTNEFPIKLEIIRLGKESIGQLSSNHSIELKELVHKLKRLIQTFGLKSVYAEDFDEIKLHGRKLKLKSIWNSFLHQIYQFFTDYESEIKSKIEKDSFFKDEPFANLPNILNTLNNNLISKVKNKIETLDEFPAKLKLIESMKDYIGKLISLKTDFPIDLRQLVYDLTRKFETFGLKLIDEKEFHQNNLNDENLIPNQMWNSLLERTYRFLTELQEKIDHRMTYLTDDILKNFLYGNLMNELKNKIESADSLLSKSKLILLGGDDIDTLNSSNILKLKELIDKLLKLIRIFGLKSIEKKLKQFHLTTNSHYAAIIQTFLYEVSEIFASYESEIYKNIPNITVQAIADISQVLTDSDRQFQRSLKQRIESINDFHKKLELLEVGKKSLQIENSYNVKSLQQHINQLIALIRTFNITTVDIIKLNQIKHHENDLNTLNFLAGIKITLPIREFIANSSITLNYQFAAYKWYSFLQHIYEFFAGYEVQKNVAAYNVASLSHWGQFNRPQGLKVTGKNFVDLAKRFPTILGYKPTALELIDLNKIINVTLKSPVQYECKNDTMTIKGIFAKSSDIQLAKCGQVENIKVHVVDTFFVDSDLNLKGIKEMIIFAFKWNILKNVSFDLRGIDGEEQTKPKLGGLPGKPGDVGKNAANFLGIAYDSINIDSLTINIAGGRGGNGQDGSGNNDTNLDFHKKYYYFSWEHEEHLNDFESFGEGYFQKYFKNKGYNPEQVSSTRAKCKYIHAPCVRFTQTFRLYSSKCCGKTGMGGVGGLGGQSGDYTFVRIGENAMNSPKIVADYGSTGKKGQDGRVCFTEAFDIKIITDLHRHDLNSTFDIFNRFNSPKCHNDFVASEEKVQKPSRRRFLNVVQATIDYKAFLLENINNKILERNIRKAYQAIDSNKLITNLYKLNDFAAETNQLYLLKKNPDNLPLYDNLLQKIRTYGNDRRVANIDREVLKILYAELVSRTMSLRRSHKSDLVIDIENFFTLITNGIENLVYVNQFRDQFNSETLAKIGEANAYLENGIEPEIKNLFEMLEMEMQKIFDQATGMQSNTRIITDEMNEVIRRNVEVRSIIGIFDTAINFLEFTSLASALGAKTAKTDLTIAGLQKLQKSLKKWSFNRQEVIETIKNEVNKLNFPLKNIDDKTLDTIYWTQNDDLRAFEDQIYSELISATDTSLNNIQNNLIVKKSLTILDIQQRIVAKILRRVRTKLLDLVLKFDNKYNLKEYLVAIDETINLAVNIHERIQNYQEEIHYTNMISHLETDFENLNITDAQLLGNNLLIFSKYELRSNVILMQYYRAINVFKQAVFPFAAKYLDIYKLPTSIGFNTYHDVINANTSTVVHNIRLMSKRIKEHNSAVIKGNDQIIFNSDFSNNKATSFGPFYVWHNDDVREKIEKLFAGQKIYLLADVRKSSRLNAVKFSVIDLDIRSNNQNINEELRQILKSFHVSLTHLGESNYRCNDLFYTIHSPPLTIEFNFGYRKKAPTVHNHAYHQLLSGIKVLSPYTLWAVQLSHGNFKQLKRFSDFVNIALLGYGQYVKENASICNSDLNEFYLLKNTL